MKASAFANEDPAPFNPTLINGKSLSPYNMAPETVANI